MCRSSRIIEYHGSNTYQPNYRIVRTPLHPPIANPRIILLRAPRAPAATLKTHASELVTAPTLHSLFDLSQAPVNGTAAVNAYPHDAEEEHVVEAQGVDIWVSSEYMAAQQHRRSRKLMMINQATRSLLPFETSRPLNPIPFHFSARYPKLHPPLALPPTRHSIFDLRRP